MREICEFTNIDIQTRHEMMPVKQAAKEANLTQACVYNYINRGLLKSEPAHPALVDVDELIALKLKRARKDK